MRWHIFAWETEVSHGCRSSYHDKGTDCCMLKLFLYILARFSIPSVFFLAGAVVGAIRVGTVRIHITQMTSIVAFIDIWRHKSYIKGT